MTWKDIPKETLFIHYFTFILKYKRSQWSGSGGLKCKFLGLKDAEDEISVLYLNYIFSIIWSKSTLKIRNNFYTLK